jgi:hypothetical protein
MTTIPRTPGIGRNRLFLVKTHDTNAHPSKSISSHFDIVALVMLSINEAADARNNLARRRLTTQ